MHDPQPDNMSTAGISLHWDKDEDLRLLAGGSLYVHPYLSTVTYLTDLGAPTMVVNCRVNYANGEWIVPEENVEGFVSWPKQGKHLSFDGRFLHAAPPDLMEHGVFQQQCKISVEEDWKSMDAKEAERCRKILERRHRRVTFLVNVWLNYKPFNVEPFPDTMIDKLTKVDESNWNSVFSAPDQSEVSERRVAVNDNEVSDDSLSSGDNQQAHAFTWPMGDCDSNETIEMHMPLLSIRGEATAGGNVRIHWKQRAESTSQGVRLCKDSKPTPAAATNETTTLGNGEGDENSGSTDANDFESSAKRMKVDDSGDEGNTEYKTK